MASEMYHLITNQVKSDDFASSFNVQSGALSQTKTKRELNVKRILCIGGSLAAVVILIILMAGTSSRSAPAAQGTREVVGEGDATTSDDGSPAVPASSLVNAGVGEAATTDGEDDGDSDSEQREEGVSDEEKKEESDGDDTGVPDEEKKEESDGDDTGVPDEEKKEESDGDSAGDEKVESDGDKKDDDSDAKSDAVEIDSPGASRRRLLAAGRRALTAARG